MTQQQQQLPQTPKPESENTDPQNNQQPEQALPELPTDPDALPAEAMVQAMTQSLGAEGAPVPEFPTAGQDDTSSVGASPEESPEQPAPIPKDVPPAPGTFEALVWLIKNDWGPNAITTHMKFVSQLGAALPLRSSWQIPPNFDFSSSVYELLLGEEYLRELYPVLKMMLGDNIQNTRWAAALASTFAIYDTARFLAYKKDVEESTQL